MRRFAAALALAAAIAVLAGFAPPASAAPVTYVAPVSGPVTDPFRPPSTQYGAGNRGLEYKTNPGDGARASAPGRVTFAGQVGGQLHVVIQHSDGVRTSYSFLRSITVRVGQVLRQGDALGTTNDTFHFGARIGDAYVDPAILIASGPARVHLVPDGEFSEQGAHRDGWALAQSVVDHFGAVSADAYDWMTSGVAATSTSVTQMADALDSVGRGAVAAAGSASGSARDALARFGREIVAVAAQVRAGTFDLMHDSAQPLVGLLDRVVNLGEWAGPFAALAAALADIIEAWAQPCTPTDVDPPPIVAPQNRIAVFVAGLGSHSSGPHARENLSRELDSTALGYWPQNVYDFSYRGGRDPAPYKPRDTTQPLENDARHLRDLLDQIANDHPGAQVDLIAHSQGGLIVREALAHDYDGPGHELPTIDHVVTLATPHHGADGATAAAWMRWSVEGRAIRRLAHHGFKGFDVTGPGVAELSETSDFIKRINARPLRDGVQYTSIASAADLTVPAVRARLANATNVVVDARPSSPITGSHSSIKQSPAARREVELAIADRPPTCQPAVATATRAFTGAAIATGEDIAGFGANGIVP
ncbi:MAG TPA: peptidoglycan DD-metalloendopeptidase family protein [Acidimicrobiales bacterium]|nr:peptidoglycan DD-metalloendopeptidase family protein [Acidimicrobiales bacterium]